MPGITGAVEAAVRFSRAFSQASRAVANGGSQATTASTKNLETVQKIVENSRKIAQDSPLVSGAPTGAKSAVKIAESFTVNSNRINQKGKKVDTRV